MRQTVLEVHVNVGAKIHEGIVVFVRRHDRIFQITKPFRRSLPQRRNYLPSDFLIERATLPEGFLHTNNAFLRISFVSKYHPYHV